MPIFDYQCSDCEQVWEEIVISKTDEPKYCPRCNSLTFRKLQCWNGMYTGEHRKAWDKSPPGNKIVVGGTKIVKRRNKDED